MGRYINWADIVARHPSVDKVGGSSEVGSSFVGYVEAQVDGLLSKIYSVPFSSNNVTVKDLCIELAYIKIANIKHENRKELKKDFDDRIKGLVNGNERMLTTSGDILTPVGETVWSSTMGYHPVFGMSPEEYLSVDSNLISDEEDDRG